MAEEKNVIYITFNSEERERDRQDLRAMEVIEDYIKSFEGDPPDTQFQLGYLFGLTDVLRDLGGKDYGEMAILFSRGVPK